MADPGIVVRVGGRAIGGPTFFGLEQDPGVPRSLLNRVYGEVSADHLLEDVTSGWDAFIENSQGYETLRDSLKGWLKGQILDVRDVEATSTRDEFVTSFSQQLELLPLTKRDEARRALIRVFERFYDAEPADKRAIAELVLNAFEVDEYRTLVRRIDETPRDDIVRLADVLRQWGLSEIRAIVERANQRLRVVEAFESLVRAPGTLELSGVHRALAYTSAILCWGASKRRHVDHQSSCLCPGDYNRVAALSLAARSGGSSSRWQRRRRSNQFTEDVRGYPSRASELNAWDLAARDQPVQCGASDMEGLGGFDHREQ